MSRSYDERLTAEFGRDLAHWNDCDKCEGTGSFPAFDGADDYVMEFCSCATGRKMEEKFLSEPDPSDLYKEMRENSI